MDMAHNSEDSDVLMKDPFVDYINDILMEEGMDDATCMQQADALSYQAIAGGFYEILGECLPPMNWNIHSSGNESAHHLHHENGLDELVSPNDGFYGLNDELHNVGAPIESLPANGHPQSSFHQPLSELGFTLKHDSRFQGHVMGSHKFTQMTELHQMRNGMFNSDSHLSSYGLKEARVSLSSRDDINISGQNCHNAIKLNDGELLAACRGKGAPVEGHRCMGEQEQGTADEEISLKLPEVDLSFEDLKLNDVYTDLYVGEPSSARTSTRDSKRKLGEGRKFGKKTTSEVRGFLDTKEVLVSCAQALEIGDAMRASEILQELRQVHGASANGTALQRIAHFFGKALAARMRGMGEHHFKEICQNMPSAATLLISKFAFQVSPFLQLVHYFANQSILKAAEGASRLHVVDFGILYGLQWPCLINALAERKGGPPLLVITGIEFPQPGTNPAEKLEESGRRLAAYAKTYNVPFQFHGIATHKWEDVDATSLHLHEGEVLVVNCIKRLRHLADESADLSLTISPRQKLLTYMRSLNPHLLIIAVVNASYNSPFFVFRFREALNDYSNVFDMLEVLWGQAPLRLTVERNFYYRDIVNVVACEGAVRVDRPETYKQWHARITKAGFQQLPIPPTILSRSRSHVKQHHHKDFLIDDDANGWMLTGWKGRTRLAISAWQPSLD